MNPFTSRWFDGVSLYPHPTMSDKKVLSTERLKWEIFVFNRDMACFHFESNSQNEIQMVIKKMYKWNRNQQLKKRELSSSPTNNASRSYTENKSTLNFYRLSLISYLNINFWQLAFISILFSFLYYRSFDEILTNLLHKFSNERGTSTSESSICTTTQHNTKQH